MENFQRMSFDMTKDDHKNLKMCCVKLGISIKDFLNSAVIEKIQYYENNKFESVDNAKKAS